MPTPREQLDIDIDAILNDAVPNQSLKPSDEGDAIKLVATYAESLQVTKVQKTTITEAAIKNMFSTPVSILNNDVSGKIKIPAGLIVRRNGAGTAYTITGNQFALKTSTGSSLQFTLSTAPLTTTNNESFSFGNLFASTGQISTLSAEEYFLSVYTANPTGGTGSIDVYVTYNEITL